MFNPFSSDIGMTKNIPIVEGALAYDCRYTCEVYDLVVRNTLLVPSMNHNVIPPFIMRAGGLIVNDFPKIHCEDSTVDDHCVSFDSSNVQIPLQLNDAFSYFHTRLPTDRELNECDQVFLTPYSND